MIICKRRINLVTTGPKPKTGNKVIAAGRFWMDTEAGKQTYLAVKNAGPLRNGVIVFRL
jgi:hypothetical protein